VIAGPSAAIGFLNRNSSLESGPMPEVRVGDSLEPAICCLLIASISELIASFSELNRTLPYGLMDSNAAIYGVNRTIQP
jgi:hypothetical protein